MIRADRPRLALWIVAATLVPLAALIWLGVRVLQQDRDIERQRRRERLEVSAGRLALDIERQLQEREERLARGEGIGLLPTGLDAGSGSPAQLLYQPDTQGKQETAITALASGELEEFQHRDLIAAAHAYRKVSRA